MSRRPALPVRALVTGAVIGAVCLILAMRGIDLREVRAHFMGFSWWYLVPAAVSLTAEFLVRSLRWRLLVTRTGFRPSLFSVYSSLSLGYFFNNLIPMRLGELVRAWLLGRRCPGLRMSTLLATIFVERLADAAMLLLMLLVAVVFFPVDGIVRAAGAILALLLAAVVAASGLLHHRRDRALAIFRAVLRPLGAGVQERLAGILDRFSQGFDIFSDRRKLAGTLVTTLINWLLIVATCWFLMRGAGLGAGVIAAVVFLVAASVASVLPSLPALLGNLQYASVLVLGLYGVSASAAFAFSLTFQLFAFLYLLPVGAALLLYEGLTPAQALALGRESAVAAEEVEGPHQQEADQEEAEQ